MQYYVIPSTTDPSVISAVQRTYENDPSITAVVDQRDSAPPPSRAQLEQRRPVLRRPLGEGHPEGARLELPMPPISESLADASLERVIAAAGTFDAAAVAELRWRSYELVSMLLTRRLGSREAADSVVPRVLDAIQDALAKRQPHTDFWRWMVSVVERIPLDPAAA